MRILHIFDDYGTPGERALAGEGSVPTVVYYLAKYAAEKGNNVTILERDHGILSREQILNGIRYVRINSNKLPYAPYRLIKSPNGLMKLFVDGYDVASKINKFLKKEEFDVVHVHFPFAVSILITINRSLREKIVYTLHADEYRLRLSGFIKPPITARFFSPDLFLMKRARKSVVLNESLKNKLAEKGIKVEKLEFIPNGVNAGDFNLNKKEGEMIKAKYELKGIMVMFVGTVTPRKGVLYLIRAAEILKEDALFLIVGNTNLDKDYAESVINCVKENNIKAKFLGFVPYEDLRALYSACDIFVLPSLEEGFGVVLAEALASGRPLIGSRVGGIPMQIRDGWNGFLVEPANEKELAEKIKYLINHPEERIRMGKNSRKLAKEEFDWKKIAEQYLEVYEKVTYENKEKKR